MRIVNRIPKEIADLILASNGGISRRKLAEVAGVTEQEARYYLRIWKDRDADSSPKALGMQSILQEKVSRQSKYIKALQKEIATEAILLDKISEFSNQLEIPKKIKDIPSKGDKKIDVRSVISTWSDWHAGEVVNLKQMEGLNEYNFDILCGRLWNLLRGMIRIVDSQRPFFEINTLHIDMLGDMVGGNIHEELRETNEFPILKVVVMLSHITSQSIAMLSKYFDKIVITGIQGNHGRLSPKPQFKNKALNNYDWLFYQMVALELSKFINEGLIEFNIPESSECVIVRDGWAFLLSHGDSIRSWNSIPYYGISRDSANQQKIRGLRSVLSENDSIPQSESLEGAIVNLKTAKSVYGFDYRELGHFHTYAVLDDGTSIMNPSMIGTNEYSLNKLHAASSPKQLLMFLSKRWGVKGIEPVHCIDKGHDFNI